jgi:signal recognition particle subunit SRP54
MGPIGQLLDMIPGMGAQLRQARAEISDDDYKQVEAIINSMTPSERRHPHIIGGSRRRRIARGSGTATADVNQLLSQFKQMQKMMGQFGAMAKKGKLPKNMPFDF